MSKLSRILAGALLTPVLLGIAHSWVNLGLSPLRLLGLGKAVEEEQLKVGFLPVT